MILFCNNELPEVKSSTACTGFRACVCTSCFLTSHAVAERATVTVGARQGETKFRTLARIRERRPNPLCCQPRFETCFDRGLASLARPSKGLAAKTGVTPRHAAERGRGEVVLSFPLRLALTCVRVYTYVIIFNSVGVSVFATNTHGIQCAEAYIRTEAGVVTPQIN